MTWRVLASCALLLCSSTLSAQTVTVYFTNPGPSAQKIFKVNPATRSEVYWGGFATGTTPGIPSQPGDVWRFRLVYNNRLVEDYRVTSAPEQRHEVQGYLTVAQEPSRSAITQMFRDLASAVQQAWKDATPVVKQAVSGLQEMSQSPALQQRVASELRAHQKEATVLVAWYANVGGALDPAAVQRLVRARDYQGAARMLRLTDVTTALRSTAPGAPSFRPMAFTPGDRAGETKLLSFGITGHGAIVIAGNAEAGMVWDLTAANPLPTGFYTSTAHGFGASLGVDAGVALSAWEVGLGGFTGRATSVGMGVRGIEGAGVALWFSCGTGGFPLSLFNNPECPLTSTSQYMGMSVQGGVGISGTVYEVNAAYTKAEH